MCSDLSVSIGIRTHFKFLCHLANGTNSVFCLEIAYVMPQVRFGVKCKLNALTHLDKRLFITFRRLYLQRESFENLY